MRFLSSLLLVALCAAPARDAAAQGNELWRAEAHERIEQHRKGTLRIVVRDDQGRPVPNAPVRVAMQRHAFGFGTAVSFDRIIGGGRNETYRQKLSDLTGDGRSFNRATPGNSLKWEPWETNWPVSRSQKISALTYLRSIGLEVRGHNLIWPGWQWLPDDLQSNAASPTYLRDRVESHIRQITSYPGIKGALRDWDVVNEPTHLRDLRDALRGSPGYPTGEEIYAEAFRWARETDPAPRLWINEYNIIANYNTGWQAETRRQYAAIIQHLIDAGAPLDGIGMQGHINPGTPTSPENVYRVLEQFAAFGKMLAVTEYDYAYNNEGGECRKADELTAGVYMRDFLTVVFSHPAVESFTIWGFWDGDHWRCDAALFRPDWSLKPSGQAFLDLVFDEWWTDEQVTTDENGVALVRGFLGDYEVSADLPGGTLTRALELVETDTTQLVFGARGTGAEDGAPERAVPVSSYPNPFAGQATIRYSLPAPEAVRLTVYDALGRAVAELVDGRQPAGAHEVGFDGRDLPGGVYFYRLTAGPVTRTGRMLLAR